MSYSENVPEPILMSKSQPVYLAKLGNVLSVQPAKFNAETYEAENPQEYIDEQGRTQIKGCDIENYIRWTTNPEGEPQSNARLVRWEDGSYTMFIGNEAFEVSLTGQSHTYHSLRYKEMFFLHNKVHAKMLFKPCSIKNRIYIRKLENALNPVKTTKVSYSLRSDEYQLQEQENERNKARERDSLRSSSRRSIDESFIEEGAHDNRTIR